MMKAHISTLFARKQERFFRVSFPLENGIWYNEENDKGESRMNPDRCKLLIARQRQTPKKFVLYWMQQSQRVHYNHALNVAIGRANEESLPLLVVFVLFPEYPDANQRHYTFMLEGLQEVEATLASLGILFIVRQGDPIDSINAYLADATTLVTDMGHTSLQRDWRKRLYFHLLEHYPDLDYLQVEADLVVPVDLVSDKSEYGAYTIRPKLKRLVPHFLDFDPLPKIKIKVSGESVGSLAPNDQIRLIDRIPKLLRPIPPVPYFRGGHQAAASCLAQFLTHHLSRYESSFDPSLSLTSKLSPYLHFGQIGVLEIIHQVMQSPVNESAKTAFLEQLIVRRELAANFIHYNPSYDDFNHITEPWAYQTMSMHRHDPRPTQYDEGDYLSFSTHDPYFNAAMMQMVHTGYMENYLRMYWAKKIIEWSHDYETAFQTILKLNNTYFLDGRDANSYAGIAWCFGKHDRPWPERPIFGKLRYMNQAGLERKFKMVDYVDQMTTLHESQIKKDQRANR
jgi:deoxyribodipyrimidine photo-lyase